MESVTVCFSARLRDCAGPVTRPPRHGCHCQAQPSQITYPAESAVMSRRRGHLRPDRCTACMFLFLFRWTTTCFISLYIFHSHSRIPRHMAWTAAACVPCHDAFKSPLDMLVKVIVWGSCFANNPSGPPVKVPGWLPLSSLSASIAFGLTTCHFCSSHDKSLVTFTNRLLPS